MNAIENPTRLLLGNTITQLRNLIDFGNMSHCHTLALSHPYVYNNYVSTAQLYSTPNHGNTCTVCQRIKGVLETTMHTTGSGMSITFCMQCSIFPQPHCRGITGELVHCWGMFLRGALSILAAPTSLAK